MSESDNGASSAPVPSCREEVVDVDGEQVPVRVQGSGDWDDTDRRHFGEIVRAAVRQAGRDVTLVPLPGRQAIAEALKDESHPELDYRARRWAAFLLHRALEAGSLVVPADRSGGEHLLAKHVDSFNAAERDERYPGKLKFANGYGTEWFPPGQWLLAREWCTEAHSFQTTGDPCWCRSDNCAYCARCGVESHD